MKIKSHKEYIDGQKCLTFFIEETETNTLIHSDTFVIDGLSFDEIKNLRKDFLIYVQDMQKMELAKLRAESHKLTEVKHKLELPN